MHSGRLSYWLRGEKFHMLCGMDDQHAPAQGSSITPESEGLTLPPGLDLQKKLGESRMATVYQARYQGEDVVVKVYSDKAARWYKNKLNKNIAVFEMAQNRAFRKSPQLLPYTAKPIRVIGQDGQHSLCFLQEYIDGKTVEELARELGGLPEGLLSLGQKIARICEAESLDGLDQFMNNTLLRQHAGQWVPVIHDFKHVPVEASKNKPGGSLLSRLLGRPPSDEAEFVRQWRAVSKKFER